MAVQRDNPYGAFNFTVNLVTEGPDTLLAGFQEVTGLNIEVTMHDYRNGNEKTNRVRKVSAMYKVGDITLKRGLIGAMNLYEWIKGVREGNQAGRNITISLMDEARTNPVMTWKITNARPMRYNGPALNGKASSDVAIEELVLSIEDLFVE